jgi:hypothetical protein
VREVEGDIGPKGILKYHWAGGEGGARFVKERERRERRAREREREREIERGERLAC